MKLPPGANTHQAPRSKIFVAILAIVGAGFLVRYSLSSGEHSDKPPKSAPVAPLVAIPLEAGACSPGKVISATKNGQIVGSYTCTEQDAAVAWVSFNDATGKPAAVLVPEGQDENNRHYRVLQTVGKGCICFRVMAGFAHKPRYIDLQLLLGYDGNRRSITSTLHITDIATPIRRLQMPSPDEIARAEKIVHAAFYDTRAITFGVNPSEDREARHETASATLLATTFCPEGASELDLWTYGQDTDLVKVQVDTFKTVNSKATLIYKGATIATIDGIRTLRLPTRQEIGTVVDARAFLQKRIPIPINRGTYTGQISMQLNRKEALVPMGRVPKIWFDSISPSVDEIGIDPLRIRIGGDLIGVDLKPDKSYKGPLVTNIPELKITLRIATSVKISSAVYVLPLQHLKMGDPAKPEAFVPNFNARGVSAPPTMVSPVRPQKDPNEREFGKPFPYLPLYVNPNEGMHIAIN